MNKECLAAPRVDSKLDFPLPVVIHPDNLLSDDDKLAAARQSARERSDEKSAATVDAGRPLLEDAANLPPRNSPVVKAGTVAVDGRGVRPLVFNVKQQ